MAAILAKYLIREVSPSVRREHVEHFIGTLDRELAKQLMVLRLEDADDIEEMLRICQRIESQQSQNAMGSCKFRQRPTSASTPTPSKPIRGVRATHVESGSSDSDSAFNGSGAELDRRKVCMTTVPDRVKNFDDQNARLDDMNYDNSPDGSVPHQGYTHCGSKKHDDGGC